MSLPFLKPKPVGGILNTVRKSDGKQEVEGMDGEDSAGLSACAADLIRAIHAKDEAGVAAALRAAFELQELQPHQEISHEGEQE